MEPRIQYAKTSDGVSIAFWTLGEGPPLVVAPDTVYSHLQLDLQQPDQRRWWERLAHGRNLVRLDFRGAGLSGREVADYSLEALVRDLEAVVERVGLDRFALWGGLHSGPVAIAYAARHPELVSHLLLWCTWARHSDTYHSQKLQETRAVREALMETHWELFTETAAHALLGWGKGETAHEYAAYMRECTTSDVARLALAAAREVDVTALLPEVRSPTLVLHRREIPWLEVDLARGIAARIPDARLALLEGSEVAPFWGDIEPVLQAVDEFLGVAASPAAVAQPSAGAVHTILFTDVEGSTALTQRLGDAKAREVLREHERITRGCLKAHGGSEVKTMGDGFMASFASATRALECAIAIQRAFAERASAHPEPVEGPPPEGAASSAPTETIRVRIGLNAGEPIAEDDPDGRGDLFGTAVIAAARIAAQAKGGEILVSNVVRELVAGKGFLFSSRGRTALRGFDDPVEVYEVRWEAGPP